MAWDKAHLISYRKAAGTNTLSDGDRLEMEAFDLDENTYRLLDESTYPPAEKLMNYSEEPSETASRHIVKLLQETLSRLGAIHRTNITEIQKLLDKTVSTEIPTRVTLSSGEPYLGSLREPQPTILISSSFLRALTRMTSRVFTECYSSPGNERNYLNEEYYYYVWWYRFVSVSWKQLASLAENDEYANDFLNRRMINETVFGRSLCFVLLHEIGHLVLNHFAASRHDCKSFKNNELEADRYAAFVTKLIIGKAGDSDDPLFLLQLDTTGFRSFFAVCFRLAGFKDNPRYGCEYPSLRERMDVAQDGWEHASRVVGET